MPANVTFLVCKYRLSVTTNNDVDKIWRTLLALGTTGSDSFELEARLRSRTLTEGVELYLLFKASGPLSSYYYLLFFLVLIALRYFWCFLIVVLHFFPYHCSSCYHVSLS